MKIGEYGQSYFQEILDCPIKFGCTITKNKLIDAGVEDIGGWHVGKKIVQGLVGGLGEVTFDQMKIGEFTIATIDLFLDKPVQSTRGSFLNNVNGIIGADDSDFGFAISENLQLQSTKHIFVASSTSLVASIYNGAKALPLLVNRVLAAGIDAERIMWGFGTAPVILFSEDANKAIDIQNFVLAKGAIASLWIKGTDDELIAIAKVAIDCGEIRLHNILSGNTFIGGKVDEAAMLSLFN